MGLSFLGSYRQIYGSSHLSRSCHPQLVHDAALRPAEGDIRRADQIQAESSSHGLRTKSTFGHVLFRKSEEYRKSVNQAPRGDAERC